MSPGPTATGSHALDRLERLLLLLPRAQRDGGATFSELEILLGVDRATIQGDLDLLTSRAAYLRAGDPADFQITIESEGVRIFSSGTFERPPRLGDREAMALVLGLRTRALLRGGEDAFEEEDAAALLKRLEGVLARRAAEYLDPLPVEDASARSADSLFRDRALDAIAARAPLALLYVKSGASAPEERRLNPLMVVHAEGLWYLLGQVPERASDPDRGIRTFRLDRILDLTALPEEGPFPLPEGFDAHEHLDERRVFASRDALEVTVDYSRRIARWIAERLDGRTLEDGSYRVVHRVADRDWFVRHVLQYAGEAVAHSPGREWVLEVLESGRWGGASSAPEPAGEPG